MVRPNGAREYKLKTNWHNRSDRVGTVHSLRGTPPTVCSWKEADPFPNHHVCFADRKLGDEQNAKLMLLVHIILSPQSSEPHSTGTITAAAEPLSPPKHHQEQQQKNVYVN